MSSAFDPFDRGTGNGSRNSEDDWTDEVSPYQNEWGSMAATTFDPSEAANEQKFERLYSWHNGKNDPDKEESIRKSHVLNDAKTFMSVLELPKVQRRRVLRILDDLDISSNNFGSRSYEKIVLALCSLVSDEHLSRAINNEDPAKVMDQRLFLTDEFRDLMDSTEMSTREHRQIRQQIRERSEHF